MYASFVVVSHTISQTIPLKECQGQLTELRRRSLFRISVCTEIKKLYCMLLLVNLVGCALTFITPNM